MGRTAIGRIGEHGRFIAEIGSYAATKALYANPPDWAEMLAWRRILYPGCLFIDVGANIGTYSLWAGDLGAKVVAVEPAPMTARRLRENVALNAYDIEVIEAALLNRTGVVEFDPSGGSTARLGQGMTVEATTLDAILGSRFATGVKIDVEGFERLVVEGASRALRERRIGCMQLEWNDLSVSALGESRRPVADILNSLGYDLFRPDPTGRLLPDHGEYGSDVFAMPNSGASCCDATAL